MRIQESLYELVAVYKSENDSAVQKGAVQRKSSQELVKETSKDVLDLKKVEDNDYFSSKVENVKKTEADRLKEAMKKPEGNSTDKKAEEGSLQEKIDSEIHNSEEEEKKEEEKQLENLHEKMSQKIVGGYFASQKSSMSLLI